MPFAITGMVILFSSPMSPITQHQLGLQSLLITALAIIATFVLPWHRLPRLGSLAPPLAVVVAIRMMGELDSQSSLAYLALFLVPLFWVALYGTQRELLLMTLTSAVVMGLPGTSGYGEEFYARMFLAGACVGTGLAIQGIMRRYESAFMRMQHIIASNAGAYVAFDENWCVIAWSRQAQQLFGYAPAQAIGQTWHDLFSQNQRDDLVERLQLSAGTATCERIEIPVRSKSGNFIEAEVRVSALREADEWSYHCFMQDISDRKAAERRLALADMIVANCDDAIYSCDPEGIVESWNEAAEHLFGYAKSEAVGRNIADLIMPDHINHAVGDAFDHHETQRSCKDGHFIDVEITSSPMVDSADELVGFSVITRDIAVRVAAERALQQANADLQELNEQKDNFVAIASHELRTPLTSMVGFARTLHDHGATLDEPTREKFLGIVITQGERLERLIEDMLTVARIESGTAQVKAEPVATLEVACNVVMEMNAEDVTVEGDPAAVAMVDEHHLRQVLINLLTNAQRYGAAPITVDARRESDMVRITVADAGEGIDPQHLPRLFEKFFQAGKTHEGTGLGLAIVKGLLQSYGGDIIYTGEPGEGARFEVTLPAAATSSGRTGGLRVA